MSRLTFIRRSVKRAAQEAAIRSYQARASAADAAAMEAHEAKHTAKEIEAVFRQERETTRSASDKAGHWEIVVSDAYNRAEVYKAYATDIAVQADAAYEAALETATQAGAVVDAEVTSVDSPPRGRSGSFWSVKVSEWFGYLLPTSIRRKAYEPYIEELKADLWRALRHCGGSTARLALCFKFGLRTFLALLDCLRLTMIDRLSTTLARLVPASVRAWFRNLIGF